MVAASDPAEGYRIVGRDVMYCSYDLEDILLSSSLLEVTNKKHVAA
jgi:hypothetical protein